MQAEVEALRLVRQQTEMPVPEVLAYDPSRQVLPSPFYCMTFVPGESLHKLHKQLTEEEYTAIQGEAGRLLAQMNQITGGYYGYFAHPDYQFKTWSQAFPAMLAGIFQDGRDAQVELPVPYADVEALAAQAYFALDEITIPNLVHWDLWDGNVFVDPATRQITGMLDFERCLWGDPLMEQNFANIWDVTGFIAGYGKDMLQTRAQKLRRSLYNLYLFAIMVIECTYRQFPTQDQENWARGKVLEEAQNLEALLSSS
jgi:aminoglycoside phosphotransferase (APT) family kinase protein